MRGLTDEERELLATPRGSGDHYFSDDTVIALERRGLVSVDHVERFVENTTEGNRALRLDAAARAVGGARP